MSVITPSMTPVFNEMFDRIRKAGPKTDQNFRFTMEGFKRRDIFVKKYSWAVPTKLAIYEIKLFVGPQRKLLEIGAGTGLWAFLLQYRGVNVTATDQTTSENNHLKVEQMDVVDAVKEYADHEALMLCWPPYDTPMANDALSHFKGDRVIYIGESSYGCTGDDAFHENLHKNWKVYKDIDIPQWDGIRDYITLYTHKE